MFELIKHLEVNNITHHMNHLLIIETLKKREKLTGAGAAKETGLKNEEAITALKDMEMRGLVTGLNGFWKLTEKGEGLCD